MFQYLIGRALQAAAPEAEIRGTYLPEFGLADHNSAPIRLPAANAIITTKGHVLPVPEILCLLRSRGPALVRIVGLGMRMEYVRRHLGLVRGLFPMDPALKTGFDRSYLVLSIRGEEILTGVHLNYTVLPIAWYRELVDRSGLYPVFLGQIGTDEYSRALRKAFPDALFVRNDNPLDDFNMLRTSVNVVLSVSSFAWLAAWISTSARRIILPMVGLYNMRDRPDIDLLPVHDRRYEFWGFPSEQWRAAPEQLAAKLEGPHGAHRILFPLLFRGRLSLQLVCNGRLPNGVSFAHDLLACWPL